MESHVFLAVLVCAAIHALWNSFLKLRVDPTISSTMLAIGGGLVATVVLFFSGMPDRAALPYLCISIIVHIFYFSYLGKSYSAGDLGQVYPIARGSAPLLTALGAIVFAGEWPSGPSWTGIFTIVAGVIILAVLGGRHMSRPNRRAVMFAAVTACSITAYSLVDGIGGRHAGSPMAYTAFLYVCNGWTFLVYGLAWQRKALVDAVDANWHLGLLTGGMSLLAYGVGVWAMSQAPIALVAALRESSILFALILATVVLREPIKPARIVGACIVSAGLVVIKFV